MFRLRFVPLVIAFGVTTAEAQAPTIPLNQWQHTAFTKENGPPVPITNTMGITEDGYLWAATQYGMLRFDGVRFTFIDSSVVGLETSTGALGVVGRSPGVSFQNKHRIYGYSDGRFRLLHDIKDVSLVDVDSRGRTWYAGKRFGYLEHGKTHDVKLPDDVPGASIIGIESDTGSGLWIGTRTNGVWHYDGRSFVRYGAGSMRALLHASDGALWTVGSDGPHPNIWRLKDGVWSQILTQRGIQFSSRVAVEGPDGSIWLSGGSAGLLRWRNGELEELTRRNGLAGRTVFWVTVAADGTVWLSSDAGLERLRVARFAPIEVRHGLPTEQLRAYAISPDGAVWNPEGPSELYLHYGGPIHGRAGPIRTDAIQLPEPASNIALAPDGVLWVLSNNGVLRVKRGQRPLHFGRAAGLPAQGGIHGLAATDGALWLRLYGGEFGRLRDGKYRQIHLPGRSSTTAMAEDGLGRIWIGSMVNPEMFVVAGDTQVTSVRLPGRLQGITALAAQGRDTMWVAGDESVIRIIDTNAVALRIPRLDTLLTEVRSVLIADRELWLGGMTGIAHMSLAEMHAMADGGPPPTRIEVLDELDGITLARSSGGPKALQRGPDGRIWFSTPDGLAVTHDVPPSKVRQPPVVHIEEVTVGGQRVNLAADGQIGPNPEKIAIHFTATGLGLAERMRIEYRLVGADRNWVTSRPPRVATYDQLRPGRYTFEVRAWNEWGIPSRTTATLGFRVTPTWYQSNWFLALCIMAVAATGAALAHFLSRRKHRLEASAVAKRYEAVLAERTRLARELHDTLLQGFTGLTLQIDGVRASLQGKQEKESQELSTILHRADRTLRDAREMVWDIRQSSTESCDLGKALREEGEALANPGGVELEYVVIGSPRTLEPTVVATILRIAREAMVNALHHARARHITVRLAYEERTVELEVRDDGCGADAMAVETASTRGHWGVAGMRERARSVGGALTLNAIPGGGTRVGVQINTLSS